MRRKCKQCGAALAKDALFCKYCGAVRNELCKNCGKVLEDDSVFCKYCGTEREERPAEAGQENAKKKKRLIILISCGVALLAIVLALIFLLKDKPEAPFFGLKPGDSFATAKKVMGEPDEEVVYELSSDVYYIYHYENIQFFDMNGSLHIVIGADEIENLVWYGPETSTEDDYHTVVKYYTNKYGKGTEQDEPEINPGMEYKAVRWYMDDVLFAVRWMPGYLSEPLKIEYQQFP